MRRLLVSLSVVLLAALVCANPLSAQGNAAKAKTSAPPDISGIWRLLGPGVNQAEFNSVGGGASHPIFGGTRPPLTAWGKEKWSQTKPSAQRPPLSFVFLPDQKDWNDPLFLCDPAGYPRTGGGNSLVRMVQTPDEVLQFFERDHFWRDLWTDGRKLPGDNAKPRWYGYAVAHWEGDTFVVDSNGYDERAWVDRAGSIHSNQMRLEERYKVLDRDHLEFTMTLTDPKAYTGPWRSAKTQIMQRLDNSDGVSPSTWGKRPDGKQYGDIREDPCIYSDEHSFWEVDNPLGLGNNFGKTLTGADKNKK
jgi:hypothetical protein